MPPAAIAVIGAGAAIGGAVGAMGNNAATASGINVSGPSELEKQAQGIQSGALSDLERFGNAGPGARDVTAGLSSQRGFAAELERMFQSGGLPSEQDLAASRGFATSAFAPQQEALRQSFEQQTTEANRLAARLGRSVDDPILQAKLRAGMMNQQSLLEAQQGSFATQLALQQPDRRLGFLGQAANVRGNLAAQAFQNRAAILGLGSQVQAQERNWNLATARKWGTSEEGGGAKGGFEGAIAGIGTAASAFPNAFSSNAPTTAFTPQPQALNFSQPLAPQIQMPLQNFNANAPVFGQSAPGFGGGRITGYNLGVNY